MDWTWLKRHLPKREAIHANPWLARLGPRLHDPELWHLNRRSAARGAACGVFFGFLIPVGQIVAAVAAAMALRGNVWLAAAATFVSNPLTYGPIYYLAYRAGGLFLGIANPALPPADTAAGFDWSNLLGAVQGVALPTALGFFIFAVTGATLAYFGILWIWALNVRRRRRSRRRTPAVRVRS